MPPVPFLDLRHGKQTKLNRLVPQNQSTSKILDMLPLLLVSPRVDLFPEPPPALPIVPWRDFSAFAHADHWFATGAAERLPSRLLGLAAMEANIVLAAHSVKPRSYMISG